MSSKNLYEVSSSTSRIYKDRETQTSQVFNLGTSSSTTPSRPLPQNIEAKSKDGKVKVFEFCEIIQDPSNPDLVSLIKETFSEEVLTTTPKGSYFEQPTANKYKYCREVIQPYLKSFCSECPSYVAPRDKLSNEPLNRPKDLPDYKPNYEVYSNSKSIQDRINSKTCETAMAPDDTCKMHCKTTFVNPEESKKCPSKTDQSKPCERKPSANKCSEVPKCSSKENTEKKSCEKPKSPTQKCDQVDENKLKCCISSCLKDSVKAVKKGSATCINEIEKFIGIKHGEHCDDKPSYYLLEKPRCPPASGQLSNSSTDVQQKSSIQKFFDSQTQTVATINCAIKNFVGTVCSKTKEAVDVLKSESCKYLNIKSESATDKSKDGKTKDCENVKSITSLIPEKIKEHIDRIDISTGCESLEKLVEPYVEPAKEVMNQVASIVLSTVSITQNADYKKIADDILDAKFNKSSDYDKPTLSQKPPKPISQEHEPSTNNNMFTTIKTKLFSIFGQKERCEDDDDDDDNDDDLTAERFFDKYCDQ